jgi:2-isopropylmalate synthase
MARRVEIYDTTLRDGSQGEGVSFSLADKLSLTKELDALGIHLIEGGWPGSNPKDMEYFEAVGDLRLTTARVAAFGSTRRAKNAPKDDPNLQALVASGAPVITIFGKSWDLHVREALRVSLEKNLEMIRSSVAWLKTKAETVIFDAEHFFDGYAASDEYAMNALEAAAEAGADALVLCDTNGGSLPSTVREVTETVVQRFRPVVVGIHTHNDGGVAEANTLLAVEAGARHVQGTMNGIGERVGNADLTQIIPNLELKMGFRTIGKRGLRRLTEASRFVCETANLPLRDNQPFVGRSAFAHKGGIHVSAVNRNPVTYEHIEPERVGNERRVLISELSGRSNILARSAIDLTNDPETMKEVLRQVMHLENQGYAFENADASFDLLIRRIATDYAAPFRVKSFRVMSEHGEAGDERRMSEATVKVEVDGREYHTVSEGDHGPVNALDKALRKALREEFPVLDEMRLVDYKVHIVNAQAAAEAKVRVVVESAHHQKVWGTVGVSANIIEASFRAILDSIEYMLALNGGRRGRRRKASGR